MFKIKDNNTHITRGDRGDIIFTVSNYHFQLGDEIIFTVKKHFNADEPVLRKIITIDNSTEGKDTIVISLEKEDTSIGKLINKPAIYEYDISLNSDITIIGYDENGAKQFILYPEGSNDE